MDHISIFLRKQRRLCHRKPPYAVHDLALGLKRNKVHVRYLVRSRTEHPILQLCLATSHHAHILQENQYPVVHPTLPPPSHKSRSTRNPAIRSRYLSPRYRADARSLIPPPPLPLPLPLLPLTQLHSKLSMPWVSLSLLHRSSLIGAYQEMQRRDIESLSVRARRPWAVLETLDREAASPLITDRNNKLIRRISMLI